MTDYNGPPLTRRERKERERLAAEAATETSTATPDAVEAESPAAEAASRPEPEETQAIDVSELIADLKAESSEQQHEQPEAAAAVADEVAVPEAQESGKATSGFGRFFGRRTERDERAADEAETVDADPSGEPSSVDDIAALVEEPEPQPEPVAAAPRTPLQRIDVETLDTVDDDEVDRVEIDEVVVEDARISSRRVADSTPAELEDRRVLEADEDTDEETPTGPTRGTGRMPVVVNVVEDTSQHHIADLRGDSNAISASSVGTGTSTITANALVLPASGATDPITVETSEGVIVTGSIDVPDGFASSGRSRGSIDTSDVDSVDDAGEVRSPETQPVRASRAVSSYANARVKIAPQRRSRNTLPIVLGVGGGVVTLGVIGVASAFLFGWI